MYSPIDTMAWSYAVEYISLNTEIEITATPNENCTGYIVYGYIHLALRDKSNGISFGTQAA
jgi:hypothetical protein